MNNNNRINDHLRKRNELLKKVKGLDTFIKNLERDFFAEATVTYSGDCNCNINLDIQLQCNFGLTESLFHFNKGNWGNFHFNGVQPNLWVSPLQAALQELTDKNALCVDINELTIQLNDTSIIIPKIYSKSIAAQLKNIITAVSENFVHFTRRLSEMPYEIFVPVFEDQAHTDEDHKDYRNKTSLDYYRYWGLYFDSDDKPSIYNLKEKSVIDESDFFLLNE